MVCSAYSPQQQFPQNFVSMHDLRVWNDNTTYVANCSEDTVENFDMRNYSSNAKNMLYAALIILVIVILMCSCMKKGRGRKH